MDAWISECFSPWAFIVHSSLFYAGQTSFSADENLHLIEVSEAGLTESCCEASCPWLAELHESITYFLPENWGAGRRGKV